MSDKWEPTIEPTPCVDMNGVFVTKGMTMTPPRSGLRCWFANVGQGASYCEPDPSAIFGAST
jgi:hypothetical protein